MASVDATLKAINQVCRKHGKPYSGYSCKTVSWDDAQRGSVGGGLSCWGGNITDTRLWAKDGRSLFTVRSDNWNERLGKVKASELALIVGNGQREDLRPVTLQHVLQNAGQYGAYAGMDAGTSLFDAALDEEVSVRFQTVFLPVKDEALGALEFASEAYNYNTRSDDDPRNLVLLCTTQGLAVQQDGRGAKKLFHHAVDDAGQAHSYWLEAERSRHKVGGAQQETEEEAVAAAARGKATSAVIGTRAIGTRFNVLMTVQVPLRQKPRAAPRAYAFGSSASSAAGGGGGGSGGFLGGLFSAFSSAAPAPAAAMCLSDDYEDDDCDSMVELAAPAPSMKKCKSRARRAAAPCRKQRRPAAGTSNAARVSRGSHAGKFGGLTAKCPSRDPAQHCTATVVLYYTVAGGVPGEADVKAAIEDLEALYAACSWDGRLADAGAEPFKAELTVHAASQIAAKVATQPYQPAPGKPVANASVFPV